MVSGYVRRARKAAADLLYNADGWRTPSKPREKPGAGFGLALEELCEAAVKVGVPVEKIKDRLLRATEDRALKQVVRGAEREDHYETPKYEDPAAGFEFEDVETELRKYGYQGKLDGEQMLKHLRSEFNLRRQTQIERDELLRELGRL